MKTIQLILSLAGLIGAFFFLTGCETTAGVGRDVEAAGDAIEGSAEGHQGY